VPLLRIAHRGETLSHTTIRRGRAQFVCALQRPAHAALRDHGQRPARDEAGDG
jgi:hypothetical protein